MNYIKQLNAFKDYMRNGPTGTVELLFEKEFDWFGDAG